MLQNIYENPFFWTILIFGQKTEPAKNTRQHLLRQLVFLLRDFYLWPPFSTTLTTDILEKFIIDNFKTFISCA